MMCLPLTVVHYTVEYKVAHIYLKSLFIYTLLSEIITYVGHIKTIDSMGYHDSRMMAMFYVETPLLHTFA